MHLFTLLPVGILGCFVTKRVLLSESIVRFRENLDMLLYADFALSQYKTLVSVLRKKADMSRKIRQMLDDILEARDKELIYNLMFADIVTVLELYLKDRIVEELKRNPGLIERFLTEYRLSRKITATDVLAGPEVFVASLLDDIIFHNIRKVDAVYRIVFGLSIIQFSNYENLETIIKFRHIVLHNGSMMNGKRVRVRPATFELACQEISNFVEGIDYYIRYQRRRRRFPGIVGRYFKEYEQLMEWDEYRKAEWESIQWPDLRNPKRDKRDEVSV